MAKNVSFSKEKFIKGMRMTAEAVSKTLGPAGGNVFIGDPMLPKFTNDGASVANKIAFKDPEEDAGSWVIRSATAKTADEVGDQTTTTACIALSIFDEVEKLKEVKKTDIKRSLYEALPKVNKLINEVSHKTTLKDVSNIAKVSSENEKIASLITEIFTKKGTEAQITVQDSSNSQCSIEMKDGYEAKVGMMSPWLITNIQNQTAEYSNVPVLCSHKKIDSITQLLSLYEKLSKKGLSKLVIVCEDMDISALGAIVDNKRRATFSTLVIKATGELLDDIAGVVGAVPIAEGTGTDFSNDDILSKLGKAETVISTLGSATQTGRTVFVGRNNSGSLARAKIIEAQIENTTNSFEKSAMQKRVGKLRSGVAVLNIGAYSEQELGYLRDKTDDAIKSVRSALEEGYIEGAGLALYRISEKLGTSVGERLLSVSLKAPFLRMLENSGENKDKVLSSISTKIGYDFKNRKPVDLIKAGIIDPAKGARVAVESAVSSIAEMIVTEVFITDLIEKA